MINWLDFEKEQLSVSKIHAFDIQLWSRYSKAWEMIEMLNFVNKIAYGKLEYLITEVFYDSKSNICTFTFVDEFQNGSENESKILQIAKTTISQFLWFDEIYHGDFLDI